MSENFDRVDGLAEYVTSRVDAWEVRRDSEYGARWREYYRMWKGIWSAEDRDRQSERCRAIMPALSQAVDSAVAEMEEATFGRERWFDVDADQQQQPAALKTADLALRDLRSSQIGISTCALLGAIYGTGIGKLALEGDDGSETVELVPIEPLEFVIDPAAETIDDAHGVAHVMQLPAHLIYERQREGFYRRVAVGTMPDIMSRSRKMDEIAVSDTEMVHVIEWHGLVPAKFVPDVDARRERAPDEEHAMVEAIVTIANKNVVLRATANPFMSRGFVAYQHSTVPGRFWGRGVMEMGYWPQKVLDAEIRSRVDALSFSTHPMMALNASAIPRNKDFAVRPGRNIFLNGAISDNIAPLQFPPPDPQTYRQSAEMERMIEMATGQLQTATSPGINAKNDTASGMSMIMGASIRRTKRAMANRDRTFIRPFISRAVERLQRVRDEYPPEAFEFRTYGTLGMMAREFEQTQLGQLLNAMGPGPEQILILRQMVENSSMMDKEFALQVLNMRLQQTLQPEQPPRDLGGEARLLSAQTRQEEIQINAQFKERELAIAEQKVLTEQESSQKEHERGIMELSIDADRVEADEVKKESDAILSLAKASAEEQTASMAQLQAMIEQLRADPPAAQPQGDGAAVGDDAIALLRAEIQELRGSIPPAPELSDEITPIRLERDSNGLITSVNGRSVQRDGNGLIQELI